MDKIKAQPHNASVCELEKLLGVSKSVISRLKKNEKAIRKEWEKFNDDKNVPVNRKRKREGKDPKVDKAKNEWLSTVTEHGVQISGPMLQKKAEFFDQELDMLNLKPQKVGLAVRRIGKILNSNNSTEKKQVLIEIGLMWSSSKLLKKLEIFSPQDIYNADRIQN